ncbi:hypothetical protein MPLA_1290007 [Mesorhizobium sp. ORS 3359]|nr:hypothetical protein MPLA_1290007 [Mesorhizobium sp. ORS 3359]
MLTVDVSETPAEAMPPLRGRLRPISPLGAPTVSCRLALPEAMMMNAASGRCGFSRAGSGRARAYTTATSGSMSNSA